MGWPLFASLSLEAQWVSKHRHMFGAIPIGTGWFMFPCHVVFCQWAVLSCFLARRPVRPRIAVGAGAWMVSTTAFALLGKFSGP